MAEKKISHSDKKINSQINFRILSQAFYEASTITFSLVFYPIAILLLSVWLDKKLNTTPLFIIVGILLGVSIGFYKALKMKKGKIIKNG